MNRSLEEHVRHAGVVTGRSSGGGIDWIDVYDVDLDRASSVPMRPEYSTLETGEEVDLVLYGRGSCRIERTP